MKTTLIIPSNFDAEVIAQTHAQFYKGRICNWMLNYICDCIIRPRLYYKEDYRQRKENNGFTNLKAEYLRSINSNYLQHLSLLEDAGVIQINMHFVSGFKARGYKLTTEYIVNGFKQIEITSNTFIIRINNYKSLDKEVTPKIDRLLINRKELITCLFDPLFSIDSVAAKEEMLEVFAAKESIIKSKAYADTDVMLEQLKIEFNALNLLIEQINNKQFKVKIDDAGRRLHTPVTRLPKYLRKHLNYGGLKLIALDLKNSQPYLSLLLLCNHKFYDKTPKKMGLSLFYLDIEMYYLLREYTKHIKAITLQDFPESIVNIGDSSLKNYVKSVIEGDLYDCLVKAKPNTIDFLKERNLVKRTFMELLFDKPKTVARFYELRKMYETPIRVFDMIKSIKTGRLRKKRLTSGQTRSVRAKEVLKETPIASSKKNRLADLKMNVGRYYSYDDGYTKFATLLQRIESHIILDVVCKELTQKYPTIPLFTVHDSVATTEEYVEIVYEKITEIFTSFIGAPPKLSKEYWH